MSSCEYIFCPCSTRVWCAHTIHCQHMTTLRKNNKSGCFSTNAQYAFYCHNDKLSTPTITIHNTTKSGAHITRAISTPLKNDNLVLSSVRIRSHTNMWLLVWSDTTSSMDILALYDDIHKKTLKTITFKNSITGLYTHDTHILVTTAVSSTLVAFDDTLRILNTQVTTPNQLGFGALASQKHTHTITVVCLGQRDGDMVVFRRKKETKPKNIRKSKSESSYVLTPFDHERLGQVCFCSEGVLLAVSNEHGSMIRIFDTNTWQCRREVRRGWHSAKITSMVFNATSNVNIPELLAVFSDRGTLHLFHVNRPNTRSVLNIIAPLLPRYFKSEWSVCNESIEGEKYVTLCFKDATTLVVLSDNHHTLYCYDIVLPPSSPLTTTTTTDDNDNNASTSISLVLKYKTSLLLPSSSSSCRGAQTQLPP